MTKLTNFIKQARDKGYSDYQIKKILLQHNWPAKKVEEAFLSLLPKYKFKNQVTIYLSNEIIRKLEKRADKNQFTLPEQIHDILRRSTLTKKKVPKEEKLDDLLVSIFSRKRN